MTLLALLFLVGGYELSLAELAKSPLLINTKSPVYTVEIINVYPHDRGAFTQGLFYHEGCLYESTGLHGKSSLRKTDLQTGKIIKKIALPVEYFAEGITLHKNRIYQLTWTNQLMFIYDSENFKKIRALKYSGEGWGITSDGKNLFMSDGSATITRRDPDTFDIKEVLHVADEKMAIQGINEMEFINVEIWANIFMEDIIARICPSTGKILGWVDLAQLYSMLDKYEGIDVLNGIAYDEKNGRIFVTGKYWPYIFEIKIKKKIKLKRG
ncbi:MAG TPA: glutaminyl-peptide cyclotransferase [Smithellaceae bacterium]|nr:glutaminyl-peptide cyclotransferase [Smithellaceae bacterium]HRS88275.1 glutaminyl-peptide cyclotransferase [Smithellaceae bacterium]HRV24920.1 glutaminyl-peptide cyclotransferase [Smithellaceae bacterium]